MELLSDPGIWASLLALVALEIILGIDNIVFIAILTSKLPEDEQKLAYRLGLMGAMFTRIGLLFTITWVMGLTENWFEVAGKGFSGRDIILLGGGLFLIGKATHEIYEKVEGEDDDEIGRATTSLWATVAQITVLDIVFSLDSVITAVGVADHLWIMVTAVVVAVLVMLIFAKPVGDFVNRYPSMQILALAFLLLIGVMLMAEGFGEHVNKGYIYFALAFSLLVELVNMRFRKQYSKKKTAKPVSVSAD